VNHTRFPKEDHLPDWARRDNKIMKGDSVEHDSVETCRSVIICEIIVHLLVMVQNKKIGNKGFMLFPLSSCHLIAAVLSWRLEVPWKINLYKTTDIHKNGFDSEGVYAEYTHV